MCCCVLSASVCVCKTHVCYRRQRKSDSMLDVNVFDKKGELKDKLMCVQNIFV